MYDLVIKNGKIIDGTGAPWYRSDVAVVGEKIVKIAPTISSAARKTIDASRLIVCPGFIDAHSHSDLSLFLNPKAESKIRQGVTTEVIGQCGYSAAPRDTTAEIPLDYRGVDLDYVGMGEYISLLRRRGVAVNVVPLIGHGMIRSQAMGYNDRHATPKELVYMKTLISQAMDQGAFGMSTGLIYLPGCFAPLEELVELSKVVKQYGGFYATHMRDEGSGLLGSIAEAIAVGRQADIAVHISHYKAVHEENWGLIKEGLHMIEMARQDGVDITLDQYPYIATSTSLATNIPLWALEGGNEEVKKRLVSPKIKETVRQEMINSGTRWDWILIANCHKKHNMIYEGKTMEEIARMTGKHPVDATLDLLLDEHFNVGMVRFAMCEEDVEYVMRHPLVMIGSDADCRAITGPLSLGKPHPRAYGTFPRVLSKYVREQHILSLEEAIRKMTGYPAARFQLNRRGLLKEGFYADITVFDEHNVKDTATYVDPHSYPQGIYFVVVNGQVVVEDDVQLDVLPGKPLCRPV